MHRNYFYDKHSLKRIIQQDTYSYPGIFLFSSLLCNSRCQNNFLLNLFLYPPTKFVLYGCKEASNRKLKIRIYTSIAIL